MVFQIQTIAAMLWCVLTGEPLVVEDPDIVQNSFRPAGSISSRLLCFFALSLV